MDITRDGLVFMLIMHFTKKEQFKFQEGVQVDGT